MILLCLLVFCVHGIGLMMTNARMATTQTPPVTKSRSPLAPYFIEPPKNVTVLVDQNYIMPCRIGGNGTIKITWYRYYEKYQRRGEFHRVLKSGNLRFLRVRPSDQAYWQCSGKNKYGSVVSKYAYMRVHAPATIMEGPTNKRVFEGTVVSVTCFVAGDPEPKITWKVNGEMASCTSFVKINDTYIKKVYTKQEYKFNATKTTEVECIAENKHINGYTNVSERATVYVIETPRGYCKPYEGQICTPHVGSRLVWYDLKTTFNESDLREHAMPGMIKQFMKTVSPGCLEPIEAMLCETMFPACINSTDPPRIETVCQEHCRAIESYFCLKEWKRLIEEPLFNNMTLPRCLTLNGLFSSKNSNRGNSNGISVARTTYDLTEDQLSSLTFDNQHGLSQNQHGSCTKVAMFHVEPSQLTATCYYGDGRTYSGSINMTEQNYPCQSWDVHLPHSHAFLTPSFFSVLVNASNSCRNPGGLRDRPWCYIASVSDHNTTVWQYCDVPVCERNGTLKVNKHPPIFYNTQKIIIITFVSLVCVSLLCLIVVFVYCICRHRREFIKYKAAARNELEIDVEKLQSIDCYQPVNPVLDRIEYPRNNIEFVRDIGRGAFGRVFKAKAPGIISEQENTVVVVKMLREEADEEMQENFEQEASLLMEFIHPNIIKLLGACAIGKPMCLLFEFMANGDLTEYLKNCRSDQFISGDGDAKLTHGQQLYIAKQICSAMVYLSNRGYIHRDLATRNCLVGEDLLIKVSDFSLARQVSDHNDMYLGSDSEAKPLRWMPLEAIVYNQFSTKSDVWSFGVVLWEIFAFAMQPYFELDPEEMIRYIKEENILACPDNTPQDVYDLMEFCWAMDPDERPNFRQIYTQIGALHSEFQ